MDLILEKAKKFNIEDPKVKEEVNNAKKQREELLSKFPIEKWKDMDIIEYSLGNNNKEAFCYLMEYKAMALGSMKGGFALQNHAIYRSPNSGNWVFNTKKFSSMEEAWNYIKKVFYNSLKAAEKDSENFYNKIIEEIDTKREVYTKKIFPKSIFLYFPDLVLPIYAKSNWLEKLVKIIADPILKKSEPAFVINYKIRKIFRSEPFFEDWNTMELAIFLRETFNLGKKEKPDQTTSVSEKNKLTSEELLAEIDGDIPGDEEFVNTLSKIRNGLVRKKQIILYGPPGTGKTFIARRFATYELSYSLGLSNKYGFPKSPDWDIAEKELISRGNLKYVTFHPSYSYEDFIEGFRPVKNSKSRTNSITLELVDGVFKNFAKNALNKPKEPFFFIIDELNRGNVEKIFGELITLLENDKRGFEVVLPLSKELFSIPDNLFIIATLNTENKGVKALDLAIRRRFSFIEIMPDITLLEKTEINGLNLGMLLKALNARILNKLGREKQIGHAYFYDDGEPVDDPDKFLLIFNQDIIPLIEEYCFHDYELISEILPPTLVDLENHTTTELVESVDSLIEELKSLIV